MQQPVGRTRSFLKALTDYDNPGSVASRLRRRRSEPLLAMLGAAHARAGRVRVLDIGGTKAYWRMMPEGVLAARGVTVTLVNLPDSPVSPDDDQFKSVLGDGCSLPQYADNSFDVVHSNSVLEHVGDWDRMVRFAREVRRLAPDYFVQTPYFWCPVEPHFMTPLFHWLPRPLRVTLVMHFALGHFGRASTVDQAVRDVDSCRLIDKRMFRHLFPDGDVATERVLFMPKSLVAIRRSVG
jgi:hypothetical protein